MERFDFRARAGVVVQIVFIKTMIYSLVLKSCLVAQNESCISFLLCLLVFRGLTKKGIKSQTNTRAPLVVIIRRRDFEEEEEEEDKCFSEESRFSREQEPHHHALN